MHFFSKGMKRAKSTIAAFFGSNNRHFSDASSDDMTNDCMPCFMMRIEDMIPILLLCYLRPGYSFFDHTSDIISVNVGAINTAQLALEAVSDF
jgi:hypothetical protein